jgi:hypothetical protein
LKFEPKKNADLSPERVMAKKKKLNSGKKQNKMSSLITPAEPWISMRNGKIIITFTSVAMAVLTAAQVVPVKGWVEGILWGLLFGVLIWVIFFGMIFVNRLLKR